jgi:ferrous iron transport protein A
MTVNNLPKTFREEIMPDTLPQAFAYQTDQMSAPFADGEMPVGTVPLGAAPVRFRGRIVAVDAGAVLGPLSPDELERRLLEMGFVEGATVEIRHQGLFGRDPIAVRVAATTIALRRAEARAVLVAPLVGEA